MVRSSTLPVKSPIDRGPVSVRPKMGRPLSFDRDKALRAAMLAFWKHGYETTSIADLTHAMGITAPSLYTAFGDKKQLFLEAMRLYAGKPEVMTRAISDAPSAREIARDMLVSAVKAYTGKSTPRGCLLASATASGSEASADVQSEVAAVRRGIEIALCRRIERDVVEGNLPAHTDAAGIAAMTLAVLQGLSILARDGRPRSALLAASGAAMAAWPQPAVVVGADESMRLPDDRSASAPNRDGPLQGTPHKLIPKRLQVGRRTDDVP